MHLEEKPLAVFRSYKNSSPRGLFHCMGCYLALDDTTLHFTYFLFAVDGIVDCAKLYTSSLGS